MSDPAALKGGSCATIATLTLNPTIDTFLEVQEVVPTHKIRTLNERLDPGGGGINVARVLARFGAPVHAIFLAGGSTGKLLEGLLQREKVDRACIPIAGETRVSVTVFEHSTGHEFRFVPEGPSVAPRELQHCLDHIRTAQCNYFVASGSLPPGVPADFYARIADELASRSVRFVLDSSADELKLAVRNGKLFLLKVSRLELEQLVGTPLPTVDAVTDAATQIVASGQAQKVAATLGPEGAVLATRDGAEFMPGFPVDARSSVGAGDSFLAAMIYALGWGAAPSIALRLGLAAGAAATLSPGTGLSHPADIERLATGTETAS
jgi:6-phosphofructokinase 2